MALVRCKECGHELSSSAERCPNCGKKPYKPSGCLIFILFAITIAILSPLFTTSKDNKSTSNQQGSTVSTVNQPQPATASTAGETDPFVKMTAAEHLAEAKFHIKNGVFHVMQEQENT